MANDEVGELVQSFNDMLDQIQRQNDLLNKEIVDRKRAEELKDEFLAAVSHELRTPLNAILGRVQLVRQMKPTGDRLERALDSLERNAESQARLVEDLLDVSRIVSGKFHMKFEVVDLRDVVSRAVEMIGPPAAAKSIHVSFELPHGPALISGDGGRIEQATTNLLSNAVKFSVDGSIAVGLSAIDSSREYAISVQDSGVGIAPEFLPMVFERFRQADGSLTREHGGLGLGLAIVKEVAELHGGSVVAASAGLGKGARFTIRLPQLIEAEVGATANSGRRRPPLLTSAALKGIRVLVVEDEAESREIAAAALAITGAAVSTAASGGEALERWANGRFDVLVCDVAMPGMDGFQVVQRIREFDHRDGHETLAIALTAYASDLYRARSLAAGFNIHLAKPYHTDELVLVIAEGFEHSHEGLGTSG